METLPAPDWKTKLLTVIFVLSNQNDIEQLEEIGKIKILWKLYSPGVKVWQKYWTKSQQEVEEFANERLGLY